MGAALRLRLAEASRRGGLYLLLGGSVLVFFVAAFGDDTISGRLALGTDLAVVAGYLAAVFFGALPLASDRETKRNLLSATSPVPPAGWALGSAAGGALLAGGVTLAFLVAAILGTAAAGGVDTHESKPLGGFTESTLWIPRAGVAVQVKPGVHRLRLALRVAPVAEYEGTPGHVTLEAGGVEYSTPVGRPLDIPVKTGRIVLKNATEGLHVGLVGGETRALRESRSFVANGLLASFGPALGAAALAAAASTASALFAGPVAAFLAAMLLFLASTKGFLLAAIQPSPAQQAQTAATGHDDNGHAHGKAGGETEGTGRKLARGMVGTALATVPNLHEFDTFDEVAAGEWSGVNGATTALPTLLVAFVLAGAAGGYGVSKRRLE
ncbi:MAG: hypothetical protein V3T86_02180 [Planctomycetota bacterium]